MPSRSHGHRPAAAPRLRKPPTDTDVCGGSDGRGRDATPPCASRPGQFLRLVASSNRSRTSSFPRIDGLMSSGFHAHHARLRTRRRPVQTVLRQKPRRTQEPQDPQGTHTRDPRGDAGCRSRPGDPGLHPRGHRRRVGGRTGADTRVGSWFCRGLLHRLQKRTWPWSGWSASAPNGSAAGWSQDGNRNGEPAAMHSLRFFPVVRGG